MLTSRLGLQEAMAQECNNEYLYDRCGGRENRCALGDTVKVPQSAHLNNGTVNLQARMITYGLDMRRSKAAPAGSALLQRQMPSQGRRHAVACNSTACQCRFAPSLKSLLLAYKTDKLFIMTHPKVRHHIGPRRLATGDTQHAPICMQCNVLHLRAARTHRCRPPPGSQRGAVQAA